MRGPPITAELEEPGLRQASVQALVLESMRVLASASKRARAWASASVQRSALKLMRARA
jgi:hypothetical protein